MRTTLSLLGLLLVVTWTAGCKDSFCPNLEEPSCNCFDNGSAGTPCDMPGPYVRQHDSQGCPYYTGGSGCCGCPPDGGDGGDADDPDGGDADDLDGGDAGVDGLEGDPSGDPGVAWVPIFKTDFESPGVFGTPADAHEYLTINENLGDPQAGDIPISDPGMWPIYYEGGAVTDRYARLAEDPLQAGNRVLHFWMQNAAIDAGYLAHTKGRVQAGPRFGLDLQVTELFMRQRVYFHPDLAALGTYPPGGDLWWLGLIIQSWWVGAGWEGHPTPARITVMLVPDLGSGSVYLAASLNDDSQAFWDAYDLQTPVPFGQWITMEVGYRTGGAGVGRFIIKGHFDDDSSPEIQIDVTDHTYNPHADEAGGTGPVPLTHWQPQKLYASDNVIHHIRDSGAGQAAQIYWDDFEFSDSWPPGWP